MPPAYNLNNFIWYAACLVEARLGDTSWTFSRKKTQRGVTPGKVVEHGVARQRLLPVRVNGRPVLRCGICSSPNTAAAVVCVECEVYMRC